MIDGHFIVAIVVVTAIVVVLATMAMAMSMPMPMPRTIRLGIKEVLYLCRTRVGDVEGQEMKG